MLKWAMPLKLFFSNFANFDITRGDMMIGKHLFSFFLTIKFHKARWVVNNAVVVLLHWKWHFSCCLCVILPDLYMPFGHFNDVPQLHCRWSDLTACVRRLSAGCLRRMFTAETTAHPKSVGVPAAID
jgi:hypothetical protein